jgi:hypothetical protein
MRWCLVMLALFLSFVSAQGETKVRIRIPVVLKLSLDGQGIDHPARVPVTVKVKDGVYEISPEQTRLRVIANTSWQLSIQVIQRTSGHDVVNLSYQLDNDPWQPIHSYAQPLRQGRGMQNSEMTVHYGLRNIPLNGTYKMLVFYTLSHP